MRLGQKKNEEHTHTHTHTSGDNATDTIPSFLEIWDGEILLKISYCKFWWEFPSVPTSRKILYNQIMPIFTNNVWKQNWRYTDTHLFFLKFCGRGEKEGICGVIHWLNYWRGSSHTPKKWRHQKTLIHLLFKRDLILI